MLNEFSDRAPPPRHRVPPALQYLIGGVVTLVILGSALVSIAALL